MQKATSSHFNEVGLHAKKHRDKLLSAIGEVISSGIFLNGKQNIKLRKKLTSYFGTKYVHTLASGHDALLLGILSLQLKKTDEVIVPANAYPTAFPVYQTGSKMVLCDVDKNGQLDINCLKKKINRRTKAIIVVHMYGLTGQIDEITSLAKKHNLTLIEDCAQSFGTRYKNKLVGTYGDIGCFSFYPTKNLGTHGDGGALITNHVHVFEQVAMAKAYGEKLRYSSVFPSGHSRLPEIQAAVLNIYFNYLDTQFNKRRNMYSYFAEQIMSKCPSAVRSLTSHKNSLPVPHLFVIENINEDGLHEFLARNNVEVHRHYPTPIHLIPAFKKLGYKHGDFPMAERLAQNSLSLPFHSYITKKQIDRIVHLIKRYYEK